MSTPLTTTIAIRDRNGTVVDEKEVATYAGLLAKAHEEGLTAILTELIQAPTEDNGRVAIVEATVETSRGRFTGLGDASPDNVNRRIVAHLIRMAETRAKARALRDAVNIGAVSREELGELSADVDDTPDNVERLPRDRRQVFPRGNTRGRSRGRSDRMSDAQRRLLFRLIVEAGHEPDDAKWILLERAGADDIDAITKRQASELIDELKAEQSRRRA